MLSGNPSIDGPNSQETSTAAAITSTTEAPAGGTSNEYGMMPSADHDSADMIQDNSVKLFVGQVRI